VRFRLQNGKSGIDHSGWNVRCLRSRSQCRAAAQRAGSADLPNVGLDGDASSRIVAEAV
jgi:hypothetical protein